MAIVKVERNGLRRWGDEIVWVYPKPNHLRGHVAVYVPDSVVENQEEAPIIDAYADVVGQPELKGRTCDQIKADHMLVLGFHVVQMGGSPDDVVKGKLKKTVNKEGWIE